MGWRHGPGGWGSWMGPGAVAPVWASGLTYGPPAPSRDTELSMLRDQASQTEGVLKEIRNRIGELEREADRDE